MAVVVNWTQKHFGGKDRSNLQVRAVNCCRKSGKGEEASPHSAAEGILVWIILHRKYVRASILKYNVFLMLWTFSGF